MMLSVLWGDVEARAGRPLDLIGVALTALVVSTVACDTGGEAESNRLMAARLDSVDRALPARFNPMASRARARMREERPEPDPRNPAYLLHRSELALDYIRAGWPERAVTLIRTTLDTAEAIYGERLPAAAGDRFRMLLGLGYLRAGVDSACVRASASDRCHVPMAPETGAERPGDTTGSPPPAGAGAAREAAELHRWRLQQGGGSAVDRWLLNLAAMLAGDYPEGVPENRRLPPSAFVPEDDVGRFRDVAPALGLDVTGLAGGAVLEDFDGDGDLDLMASSQAVRDPLRYFRNEGDGTFTERTDAAGIRRLGGGRNLKQADYDNDGDVDVLVLRGGWQPRGWPNSLLRNDGDGTFTDVTRRAGLLYYHPTQTAAWGDYDNDGDLDLYVGNETGRSPTSPTHASRLHRNEGDGTFTDVAPEAGVDVRGFVKGVDWGDYDNDGRLDLYVSVMGEENRLFRNEGPGGGGAWRFRDVAAEAGVTGPDVSFPVWFFDYDNDGWQDLYVSAWGMEPADVAAEHTGERGGAEPPRLYRNEGDGTFADVTSGVGLERALMVMGSNFGDLDNDGWPDLFLGTGNPDMRALFPTRVFRNDAGERFLEVTTSGGFGHIGKGHGVSFGDVDGDGDQDVYAVYGGAYEGDVFRNALYENPGHDHRWLTLRLEGRDANRDGIGARIRVVVETAGGSEREIRVTAGSGASFGASSLQQEIGLGDATRIRRLEIRWPGSGTVDEYGDVEMDRVYEAREGAEELTPVSGRSAARAPGGGS